MKNVNELGLSFKVVGILKQNGINTLEDLMIKRESLKDIKGIGQKTLDQINAVIAYELDEEECCDEIQYYDEMEYSDYEEVANEVANELVNELEDELEDDTDFFNDNNKAQEVINNAWEEVINELEEEAEDTNKMTLEEICEEICKADEKDLNALQKIIETISGYKHQYVYKILNADYRSSIDYTIEVARESVQKLISKNKGKSTAKETSAFKRVKDFLKGKEKEIEECGMDEETKDTLLKILCKFIKSLIVKVLKVLLATGKIIGKAAMVIEILITKIVVFVLNETLEAGKSIIKIAIDEYKIAIR